MASSGSGSLITCHTPDDWNAHFAASAADANKLVVVDFSASWCGPCRTITPFLVECAKKYTDVMFLKIDVDELESVSSKWQVEVMPTFVFLKEGKEVDRIVGANREELNKKFSQHRNLADAPA